MKVCRSPYFPNACLVPLELPERLGRQFDLQRDARGVLAGHRLHGAGCHPADEVFRQILVPHLSRNIR